MRFLAIVVTFLLIGCDSDIANKQRDYSGVFDGEIQVDELIEKVKLADRYFFKPDQKIFIGLPDGKIMPFYKGTLAREARPAFLSANVYHITFGLFAGKNKLEITTANEGLAVVGISPEAFKKRADREVVGFLERGAGQVETISEFVTGDGRCHLMRRERQGRVFSTLAIVKISASAAPTYNERQAKGAEFIKDEIAAVFCVNIAHLYHLGFSNISAVQHDDVVQIMGRNDLIFPLYLKLYVNAIAYRGDQTGMPRKDFLRNLYVWLLAETEAL